MKRPKTSADYGISAMTILDNEEPYRSRALKMIGMTEEEFAAHFLGAQAQYEENARLEAEAGLPLPERSEQHEWAGFGSVVPS